MILLTLPFISFALATIQSVTKQSQQWTRFPVIALVFAVCLLSVGLDLSMAGLIGSMNLLPMISWLCGGLSLMMALQYHQHSAFAPCLLFIGVSWTAFMYASFLIEAPNQTNWALLIHAISAQWLLYGLILAACLSMLMLCSHLRLRERAKAHWFDHCCPPLQTCDRTLAVILFLCFSLLQRS